MSTSAPSNPQRGEVWRVALDPVRGSEQAKTRPAVVMSEPGHSRASVRVCVPLIGSTPANVHLLQCVPIAPDAANGLSKDSTADAGQVRTLDKVRFEKRLGVLEAGTVEHIAAAVALVVGYTPRAAQLPDEGEQSDHAGKPVKTCYFAPI